jgi:hypothetical protein
VQSKNQMFTKYLLRKNELVEQGELRERERWWLKVSQLQEQK